MSREVCEQWYIDWSKVFTRTTRSETAHNAWQACQQLNDKRIENYKSAYDTWQEKTEWVQKTAKAKELGMHRADVLKQRIADLLALVAKKDALISHCIEENGYLADGDNCTLKPIIDALALTVDDVELVEVGVVCFEDTLVGVDLINPTVKHGDKCYTIKQKSINKLSVNADKEQ